MKFVNVIGLNHMFDNVVSKVLCSWCITWVLFSCTTEVYCTLDKFCSVSESYHTSSQGICGEKLSDILQLLCGMGGYHKRSIRDSDVTLQDKILPSNKRSHNHDNSRSDLQNKAFLSKAVASSFLLSKRGKWDDVYGTVVSDGHFKQGIVCECCQNRCSVTELMQYCRQPSASSLVKRFWKSTLSAKPKEKANKEKLEENIPETHNSLINNEKASKKSVNEVNKGNIVSRGNT